MKDEKHVVGSMRCADGPAHCEARRVQCEMCSCDCWLAASTEADIREEAGDKFTVWCWGCVFKHMPEDSEIVLGERTAKNLRKRLGVGES